MKKLFLLLCAFVVLGGSVYAQKEEKNQLDFPVTKERLISVLQKKALEEPDIIDTLNAHGADFQVTPVVEKEMRRSGASSKIVAATRRNYRYRIAIANGRAENLVVPKYPGAAKAVKASGSVNVLVLVNEDGNVIDARVLSGHALLAPAALEAARASSFKPMLVEGRKVKVTGIVVYNFVEK